MRDRVNLQQAVHQASHDLAANYRNLARYYEQYLAYKREPGRRRESTCPS